MTDEVVTIIRCVDPTDEQSETPGGTLCAKKHMDIVSEKES